MSGGSFVLDFSYLAELDGFASSYSFQKFSVHLVGSYPCPVDSYASDLDSSPHPADSLNSYLYLAKIYNHEENQSKEEHNLETALLIEPNNEEAMLMMMKIAIEQSNYDKVKNMSDTFSKVCKNLCNENQEIKESLKNIDPKNLTIPAPVSSMPY